MKPFKTSGGRRGGKLQLIAARWLEGGSSGHSLETEELVWESESKLTPSSRESGQGVSKDQEQEKRSEETLLGGWNLCFASECVALKEAEDNHCWLEPKSLCSSGDQSIQVSSWDECSLMARIFSEQKLLRMAVIQPLTRRLLSVSQVQCLE